MYLQSFMQKLEFLNLEPKMPYLGVLGSNFEKTWSYLKSAPLNLPICKIWRKNKNAQIWDQKCHICFFF